MLPTSFRNLSLPEMTLAGDSALVALTPQDRPATSGRNALISLALSLAVIGAVVLASGRVELSRLPSMVPASPAFWLAFLASYFVTPAGSTRCCARKSTTSCCSAISAKPTSMAGLASAWR